MGAFKKIILTFLLLFFIYLAFSFNESPVFVLFTVDVEPDLPPFLSSFNGVEYGLPLLLDIFNAYNVKATFFVSGNVALDYPELVKSILSRGHELGGHGFFHENFTGLPFDECFNIISRNIDAVFNVSGVRISSFRAPYHSATSTLDSVLLGLNFSVEASHTSSYPFFINNSLLRLSISPLFYPSTVFNNSWVSFFDSAVNSQHKRIKLVVIGLHPWELVEMPFINDDLDLYTRPSGNYTVTNLVALLNYLKSRNVRFVTASEFSRFFGDY